jgi:hypothetical protein
MISGTRRYETCYEIEIALARYLDYGRYVMVPNLSYGMFSYEMDLCALNKSMYAFEFEIKISRSDLKRDAAKHHHHMSEVFAKNLIRGLWFVMPEKLRGCEEFVPERAGIMFVDGTGKITVARRVKPVETAKKWTFEDAYKLARLGTIRYWSHRFSDFDRCAHD